ncbi:protein of unknown function [Taphrina deformans PYCC 5710]|uniref:Dystroglycan-type cadherin-like domain-containing protein n=1 Tax=Taphrina deformans (strain PYCC 5710 / ATCC 11124 / CBS 356.35 / IMI 108563 / JCM 9778 / NBRC 8474) TaxID=1097556 RepID=R4XNP8_TAPDE|nr:protein of unknown function [Taphrina deformans PYCC 5710]|eukprot:CCG84871.1 protein of unknown function [Taphrina deformans PYCC 5710]
MLGLTLSIFLLLIQQACSLPTLAYPFNSQVPPVARIGQYYNYTLAKNTFANFRSDIRYTLSNAPTWLSFDPTSLTLSGTPAVTDEGNPTLQLVATDSTGSATDSAVLVVSSRTAPYVSKSLESQLQSVGSTDGKGALILTPSTAFHITFSKETFAETGANVTAYYGTSDNFTPLPSWISFDATTIQFTGTAPPVVSAIAPPQYFEFVLVGTDYPGFAGISATFQIVIGAHQLSFSKSQYDLIASIGTPFQFQVPVKDLIMDGTTISADNITSVSANTTGSWLSFNSTSYTLAGTPNSSISNVTTVAVTFKDRYSDVASTNIKITLNQTMLANTTSTTSQNSTAQIFSKGLPVTFNAIPGTFFSYTFNTSVVPSAATLNITISGASWLHYNAANKTLYGEVPIASKKKRQTTNTGTVTVTASNGGQSETQTIGITLGSPVTPITPTTPSTTSATTTSSATATDTAAATSKAAGSGLSSRQKLAIGLGISLPILIACLAILLCCCLRRKRKAQSSRSVSSSVISRPVEREKDEWPQPATEAYDEPRQLGAFEMFKSNSSGRLSGYAVEVNQSGMLAPPLAPLAHELPPLPESPGFEAVRSAYGSEDSRSRTISTITSTSSGLAAGNKALSVNQSIGNVQPVHRNVNSIKQVYNVRRSVKDSDNRDSTNTMDTVSTDELFSVRLVGDSQHHTDMAPPIMRAETPGHIVAQPSAQTIGTYTSSENDHIQRYGSQGESLSSGPHSRHQLSQISRNDSSQPQPWRVINSQDSYDSFGSYATTDSHLSDEFSFDESLSGESQEHRRYEEGTSEETDSDVPTQTHVYRPESDAVLLAAPLSPDWAMTPRQASVARRPTMNERVASMGKARLMESTARRPMSSASIGSPDVSAETETSAEIAFV